jgi:hypothetical protein
MLKPHHAVCLAGLLFAACGSQPTEAEIIGSWIPICSMDVCTIITFAPDHTFAQRFEASDSPYASGTWLLERGQLMMRILATRVPDMKQTIGKEARLHISQVQKDSFVATNPSDGTTLTWKRDH